MKPRVKTCGLTTAEAVVAASNADYIGFIFYPPSVRNIAPEWAGLLAAITHVPSVAVTVNPDDALLQSIFAVFKPHYIQLHGNESPARVFQIKDEYKVPVIKAFNISSDEDIAAAHAYEDAADMLMFDAKVPGGLQGGTGLAFDWKLLAGRAFKKPWFLSGGLGMDNVEEALGISGAEMVDASSSLESAPGVKDPELVRAFVQKVKSLSL